MARAAAFSSADPRGTPEAGALLRGLMRLAEAAAGPLHARLSESHQISLNEWRVLDALQAQPGATASALARASGLDKMSVSRALAALETAGRVARKADPADGRRAQVALTAAGRRLHQSVEKQLARLEAELMAPLSDTDRRQLARLLDRLEAPTP